jgi:hypothetical protein
MLAPSRSTARQGKKMLDGRKVKCLATMKARCEGGEKRKKEKIDTVVY